MRFSERVFQGVLCTINGVLELLRIDCHLNYIASVYV